MQVTFGKKPDGRTLRQENGLAFREVWGCGGVGVWRCGGVWGVNKTMADGAGVGKGRWRSGEVLRSEWRWG